MAYFGCNKVERKARKKINSMDFFSEEKLHNVLDNDDFDWRDLNKVPHYLFTDRRIIKKFAKQSVFYFPDLVQNIPNSFKSNDKNINLMKSFITQGYGYQGFRYLPAKLRKNKSFVLDILETYKNKSEGSEWIYDDCSKKLKDDREVALMAMQSGTDPRALPKKFLHNKSMIVEYAKFIANQENLENKGERYFHHSRVGLDIFNFNKVKFSNDFANSLMQISPKNYKYLDKKYTNKKEFAMRYIKIDIGTYESIPNNLRLDTEIMDYVFSREPNYCEGLDTKDILKKDFSKMNLGREERQIIYSYCEKELHLKYPNIFQIAQELAHAKEVIFKPPQADLLNNSFNSSDFNKHKVLRKIQKHPFSRQEAEALYRNISFKLKNDLDILLKLGTECNLPILDFGVVRANDKLGRQINQRLFAKRKYGLMRLPRKNKKLRKYMISKIFFEEQLYTQRFDEFTHLKDGLNKQEREKLVDNYVDYVDKIPFFHRQDIGLIKNLSKAQIAQFIDNFSFLKSDRFFTGQVIELFGSYFKKSTELAKIIFLHYPEKRYLKVLDLDYLMKSNSFNNFLKNVPEIALYPSDFKDLPLSLKTHKIFIQKVLKSHSIGDDFIVYEQLPSVLKTDKEITDYVFTYAPWLAKGLTRNEFKKIDTSNLHPASRQVIYRKYLSISTDNIFEKVIMKQKLLQIKDSKKAS